MLESLLRKLQAWGPAILSKSDSSTGISCEFSETFNNNYCVEDLRTAASEETRYKIAYNLQLIRGYVYTIIVE